MERIEGTGGVFYLPIDELPKRVIEGVECLEFDECSALCVVSELELGAHALLNPGKPFPEKRRLLSYNPEGRQLSKRQDDITALEDRVAELEAAMVQVHRIIGDDRRLLEAKIKTLQEQMKTGGDE